MLQLYVGESVRVLKPGGHMYMSWKPSWQSRRGHHIHPDVVRYLLLRKDLSLCIRRGSSGSVQLVAVPLIRS